MARLKRLGYWRGDSYPAGPDPAELIDLAWDADDRDSLVRYLGNGTIARAYMGRATCRICGCENGSLELTDGVYLWPEGLAHYVEAHAVRLPREVVEYVISRHAEMAEAEVDDDWWLGATGAKAD